jgi:uncharacterized protein YndB with AHSA1/START domain
LAGMESTIEIERPVDDVFGFFLDMEHSVVRTDPAVESVVKTTEGPLGAGSSYRIRQRVMGRVRDQETRITAVEPNHRIDIDASFGPVRPRINLTFEPTAKGTSVTFRGDSRPVGPFRLVTPLMDRIGQRNWDRRLRFIKTALEASPRS